MDSSLDQIVKRDGSRAPFDSNRIQTAITKALKATNQPIDQAFEITTKVCSRLSDLSDLPSVEQCQDLVEEELMNFGYNKVAKNYILYRSEHAKLREKAIPEDWKKQAKEAISYFDSVYNYIVYLRTYAKWIPEKNRRETWPETVDRFMDFMREIIKDKLENDEYDELREGILKMEVMPSMRMLQFSGEAVRRNHICGYNCSFIAPSRLRDFHDAMLILMCGCGVGFSVEKKYVDQLPVIKEQKRDGSSVHTYIVEDNKEDWCDAFLCAMGIWYNGNDIKFNYEKIRPAGTRLITSGGRASGPAPLKELMEFARTLILNNQGVRLSTINVHDLMCKIGKIVVTGGVRRAAMISLSDLHDESMRNAKIGNFWATHPDRCMANNSAVYNKMPDDMELLSEWASLAQSGSGERGIFNRGSISANLPQRRSEMIGDNIGNMGTNPCVVGDTWVLTSEGPRQVIDLVDDPISLIVNGKEYPVMSNGFFKTGLKKYYKVETKQGFQVKLTEDHPFMIMENGNLIKRKLKDLKVGNEILLSNHIGFKWGGIGSFEQGWLIGQIVGDGGICKTYEGKSDFAYCRFWGDSARDMSDIAFNYMKACCVSRTDVKAKYNKSNETYQVGCADLLKMAISFGMTYNKEFTSVVEKSSSNFYRGFLRGFFDADGTVIGTKEKGYTVRLAQSNINRLKLVQRMLYRMGIISKIYQNRTSEGYMKLPDSNRELKEYYCKAMHELVISKDNLYLYHELINFHEPLKRDKLRNIIQAPRKRGFYKEKFTDVIKFIEEGNLTFVYDVTVDTVHEFCANGIRISNCGEIFLLNREFCNLSTIVMRKNDNYHSLMRKIRLATILGTYQSMLTDFNNIAPEWKEWAEKERLLGVSLNGQRDCHYLQENLNILTDLKYKAIEVNKEYAARFGINQSTAITTVKPEGTSSQMLNTSSGIHPRFSPYYIRRIRITASDPLAKLLIDQGVPHHPENGQVIDNVNTWVFEFPQKSPEGAVCADQLSAEKQLEYWKQVKTKYTEHNPSCTIYVKKNEWFTTLVWVHDNWDIIGGLSFLPYNDHVYELAPYEKIIKEEYEKLVDEMPKVDFAKMIMFEKTDNTSRKQTWACVGDKCEIIE